MKTKRTLPQEKPKVELKPSTAVDGKGQAPSGVSAEISSSISEKPDSFSAKPQVCFVTGATGLVGSHLILDLLRKGHRVKALARSNNAADQVRKTFSYYVKNPDEWLKKIEWVKGDILDKDSIEAGLKDVTQVYHVAGYVSFDPAERDRVMQINVDGTKAVTEACLKKKVEKLCFVSSTSALGGPNAKGFIDETTPFTAGEARSVYSLSKEAAEKVVWDATKKGLPAVVVNPSIILGPGDWDKGSSKMVATVARGMPFYTRGVAGFVDVRDVTSAMTRLMESDVTGERFVLAGANVPYREVFNLMADELGASRPFIRAPGWLLNLASGLERLKISLFGGAPSLTKETVEGGQAIRRFSHEKITSATGMTFRSFEETIRDTCRHYRKDVEGRKA